MDFKDMKLYDSSEPIAGSSTNATSQSQPSRDESHCQWKLIVHSGIDSFKYPSGGEFSRHLFQAQDMARILIPYDAKINGKTIKERKADSKTYKWRRGEAEWPCGVIWSKKGIDNADNDMYTCKPLVVGARAWAADQKDESLTDGKTKINTNSYRLYVPPGPLPSDDAPFLLSFIRDQDKTVTAYVTSYREIEQTLLRFSEGGVVDGAFHRVPEVDYMELPTSVCFSRIPTDWNVDVDWMVENQERVYPILSGRNWNMSDYRPGGRLSDLMTVASYIMRR